MGSLNKKVYKLPWILLFSLSAKLLYSASKAEPNTQEPQLSAGDHKAFVANQAIEALLIIKGIGSSGSGFLTVLKDRVFAVTNLHVLSHLGDPDNPNVSIKTVQNENLQIERIFGAQGHDIALIQFANSESFRARALAFKGNTQSLVQAGDRVQIPGNAQGRGVILWTPGAVNGVGATEIEHSAPTYSGNSGSPVIHVASNSVIGVHTYATYDPIRNPFDQASRNHIDSAIEADFRHFAYRLDTPQSWYQIDLRKFHQQSEQLQQWQHNRRLAVGFIQSFLGYDAQSPWWEDSRLQAIASDFIDAFEKMSSARRGSQHGGSEADESAAYAVILPQEQARLRKKVIGQLQNYIGLVDKKAVIKDGTLYPFFEADYLREIEWAAWLTDYLHTNREFLSE